MQDLQGNIDEKISSLEILCIMSDGKCRTQNNYQKNKILDENVYLLELIVLMTGSQKFHLRLLTTLRLQNKRALNIFPSDIKK